MSVKPCQNALMEGRGTSRTAHQSSVGRANTQTIILTHNLQSTWLTCGWTVGGKQTTQRKPTQGGEEHVNFTKKGSKLIFEHWTCSALKVYKAAAGHSESVSLHSLFLLLIIFSQRTMCILFLSQIILLQNLTMILCALLL